MNYKKKIISLSSLIVVYGVASANSATADSLGAIEIYQQARTQNYSFLQRLTQYRGAIDIQNRMGDTAYCVAMKYNDEQAQHLLLNYGANPNHSCVTRFKAELETRARYDEAARESGRRPIREVDEAFAGSGTNYAWWGLGALVVGGGAVALAGGGGGSGGSGSSSGAGNSGNTGGNDGGNSGGDSGNTNGDDGGNSGGDSGNTGGDDGGNSGGDSGNTGGNDGGNSGNTGGDDGGSSGGDSGNTGGDDGGNSGGDSGNTGGASGGDGGAIGGGDGGNTGGSGETNLSASVFKTNEYNRSNFLAGINAAEAYSYMYKQDADGNLVSHQVLSDDPLKKVKVGVLDTGVYANSDLDGKIVSAYDINEYNSAGNVQGLIKGNIHYYIYTYNGAYYLLRLNTDNMTAGAQRNMTAEELNSLLANYGLSQNDFSVMNGNGSGNPGTSQIGGFEPKNIDTWWKIAENLSHGTHVAGIIAGNKNDEGSHGVAFENAEIVAGSWDMSQNIYGTVKNMVDEGVAVINNSWGINASDSLNASDAIHLLRDNKDIVKSYVYAAQNGAVWVQATGNDGYTDASVFTGLGNVNLSSYGYSGSGKYEVPFIAVTALDYSTRNSEATSGTIAGYANYCGSTAGYCLAAPGSDVVSTGAVDSGSMAMDGTSMATPVVSGSIALLMGYYPWLSAQNVAYILVATANKNGVYADSNIYGQGALDLEAAVTVPIDSLSLASSSSFDSTIPVQASKLSLSGTLQNRLLKALPQTVTAFDALNRPFEYNTENLITTTHGSKANLRHAVARAATGGAKKTVKNGGNGFAFTTSESMGSGGKANLSTAEVISESSDGATRFYYAENSKYEDVGEVLAPSSNPYFAMNEAYGAENTLKLSETSKFKLSLQTGENGLYERDYEQDNHSFKERSYAFSGEYSFNVTDFVELAAMGGMLFENDALLGLNGTGGFGIKDTSTYFMGIRAALNLTPNMSLIAAYYRGYTQGADTPLLAISDLETESFMMAGEYRLNATDKVGVSFSSPLSVVKGRASLLYANGRDNNSDTVYMNKLTTSLTPEAREYDLGLYYQGQPKENFGFMGKVQARFNADGEKGVTDYIGLVGTQYNFQP